jgi:hypothetical protein
MQLAIGGAVYGYIVKQGLVDKLPALPFFGRTGTAAIMLDYWARHGGGNIVHKASRAAAAIAGYQLGHDGTISGDAGTPTSVHGDTAEGDMDGYGNADFNPLP